MSEKNLNYWDWFLSQAEADNLKNLKTIDSKVVKDYQVFYKEYTKDEIKIIQLWVWIKNADGIIGKNTIMAILSWQKSIWIKENWLVHKSYLPKLKAKYEEKISTQNNSKKERQALNNDIKLNLLKNQTNDIIKSQNDLIKQYKEDTWLGVKWIDNVFWWQQVLRNYESMFENGKDRAKKLKTKIEEELKTNSSLNNSEKNALNNLIWKLNEIINAKFEWTNIFSMAKVSWENRWETVYNWVEWGKWIANWVKESLLWIYEFTKLLVNFSTSYFKWKEWAEYREKIRNQATDLFEAISHLNKDIIIEWLKKTFDHISWLSWWEKAYAIWNIAWILIWFLLPIKWIKWLEKLEKLAKQNALKNGATLSTKLQQTAISIWKYILNWPAEQVLWNALSQSLRWSISIIQSKNSLKLKVAEIDKTIKLLEGEIWKTKDLAKKEELNKALASFKEERIKLVWKPKATEQISVKDKKAANDEVYKTTEAKTQVAINDEYYEVKKVANWWEIVVVNNNSVKVKEKWNKFIEPKDNNKTKSEKINISENEVFTLENFPKEKYLELANFLEKNLTKSKLVNTHLSAIIKWLKNGNITQKDLAFKINFIKSSNPHINFKFLDDYLKNIWKNTEVPSKNTDFVIIKEEPKKSKVASEEVLVANWKLSDSERIAKAAETLWLKRLTKEQKNALLRAHNLPQWENFKKWRILMSKWENWNPIFTREQSQKLMDEWIAGRYEANTNSFKSIEQSDIKDFETNLLEKKLKEIQSKNTKKDFSEVEKQFREMITPSTKIEIDGKKFLFSNKIIFRDYEVVFWFSNNWWETKTIFFYRSKSWWNWRASPGIEKSINNDWQISRAWSKWEFAWLDYEKWTIPIDEIWRNLDNLTEKKINAESTEEIEFLFWVLDDNAKNAVRKEVTILDWYFTQTKNVRKYNSIEELNNAYKSVDLKGLDRNLKLVSETKWENKFLWPTTSKKYETSIEINGKQEKIFIEFSYADSRPDLPWVENITHSEAKVNNYGFLDKQINLWALASKPLDYWQQIGFFGELQKLWIPLHWNYRDLRFVIQENPLIKIFKNINWIDIKDWIYDFYKSWKEFWVSERSFQAIKSINSENIDILRKILLDRSETDPIIGWHRLFTWLKDGKNLNHTFHIINNNRNYLKMDFLEEFADKIWLPKDLEVKNTKNKNIISIENNSKNTFKNELIISEEKVKNSETNINWEKIETFWINKEDFEIISKLTEEQKTKILTELFQEISNLWNKIPKKELKKIRMKVHPDRVSDFEKNFNEINEILKKYNLERDLLKDFRNKTVKTENFDNFWEQKNNSKNYSENTKKSDINNENNSWKNSENTNSSDRNTENNINTWKTEEVKLENNIKTEAELKDYLTKNYSEKLKTWIKLSIILATWHTIYAYAKNNNTNEIILTNDLNQEIKTEEIKYLLNTVSNKEYIWKIINSEFISDILNPKIEEIIAILKNPELRKIWWHTYVFALQSALSMIGFWKNLWNVDWWLWEKTISALKDFQVSVAEKYSISEKNFWKFEKTTTESLINELNKLKNT